MPIGGPTIRASGNSAPRGWRSLAKSTSTSTCRPHGVPFKIAVPDGGDNRKEGKSGKGGSRERLVHHVCRYCLAFHNGKCSGCNHRHRCYKCDESHQVSNCPKGQVNHRWSRRYPKKRPNTPVRSEVYARYLEGYDSVVGLFGQGFLQGVSDRIRGLGGRELGSGQSPVAKTFTACFKIETSERDRCW